jgi:signal transduction histidine kinase
VSMRPLEKLPTIRAKLGSVIVIAVAVTVLLIIVVLGYALRDTKRDTDRLLLSIARRAADGQTQSGPPGVTIVRVSPQGVVESGTPPVPLPRITDGMVHVGLTPSSTYNYAVVPVVENGVVTQMVFALRPRPPTTLVARLGDTLGFLLSVWWRFLLAGALAGAVALLLARWIARGMTKPLRDMAAAARRMEVGDYSVRVTTRSRDEVGQLANAFNRMSGELENLEQTRRELVANVSHELKTPIAAIRAHLENLLDGVEQPNPRTLEVMLAQSERLGRLVEQLLDLSRLESGEVPLQRESVPVAALVARVISEISVSRAASDVTLRAEVGDGVLPMDADPERLHQVLFNLVDNAVRFTPPGGEVVVAARPLGGAVEVSVRDTGVGIADEHLPRLFERFYRVDASRSREDGGTGIGLAIARSVVEAHGGHIRAASELGRGSVFTFDIPVSHEAPPDQTVETDRAAVHTAARREP